MRVFILLIYALAGLAWAATLVAFLFNFNLFVNPRALLIVLGGVFAVLDFLRHEGSSHSLATRYLRFLEQNGLQPKRCSLPRLLMKAFRCWLSKLADVRYDLLLQLGTDAIRDHFNHLTGGRAVKDVDVDSHAHVSLAMFLRDVPDLRSRVCRETGARPDAVKVVFAYLEFREDLATRGTLGGRTFVSVDYLMNSAEQRIQSREDELRTGFAKELQVIKELLDHGEWVTSLPVILRHVYRPVRPSTLAPSLTDLEQQKPWLRSALQRLFTQLRPEVVERYLVSRDANAYLLTFRNPRSGKVAARLKALIDPSVFQKAGVTSIYDYEQYTGSARIGLVPRSPAATQADAFDAFAKRLEEDLRKVFTAEAGSLGIIGGGGPVLNTELLLHRLGLSGRDYHYLDIPGATQRRAIFHLRSLLARGLDTSELLAVLEYEMAPVVLLDSLTDTPFVSMCGLSAAEQNQLSPLSTKLQSALLRALNEETSLDVSNRLRQHGHRPADVVAVVRALRSLLPQGPQSPWNAATLKPLVTNYLETLEALAWLRQQFREPSALQP